MRYSMNVENPCKLSIGYVGENIVTEVAFDYSTWVEAYGDGVLTLALKRRGDAIAYPVELTELDEHTGLWIITATDVANSGRGYGQLHYIVGDAVKKSAVFILDVSNSLDDSGESPEPYESILNQIVETISTASEEAKGYANDAKGYSETASEYADSARGYAEQAEEVLDDYMLNFADSDGVIVVTRGEING